MAIYVDRKNLLHGKTPQIIEQFAIIPTKQRLSKNTLCMRGSVCTTCSTNTSLKDRLKRQIPSLTCTQTTNIIIIKGSIYPSLLARYDLKQISSEYNQPLQRFNQNFQDYLVFLELLSDNKKQCGQWACKKVSLFSEHTCFLLPQSLSDTVVCGGV